MNAVSGSTTAARSGGIQMKLAARAENVALVRHALAGAAESLGMDEAVLADLKTVVTEACMNVVVHAYGEEPGPLEVNAWPEDDEFVVVVRDYGSGIRPRPDSDRSSLRLGISLIAAMTKSFEIAGGSGRGTTISMRLALRGAEPVADETRPAERENVDDGAVMLTAWNTATLPSILARVVSVLASRRDFSVDELSDAVLFSDVVSSDLAAMGTEDPVQLRVIEEEQGISLRIGPLEAGMANELRQGFYLPDEIGGSLETLAEEVEVRALPEGEYLYARFSPAQAAG